MKIDYNRHMCICYLESISIIIMKKMFTYGERISVCICIYWEVAGVNAMDSFHAAAFSVLQFEFVVTLLKYLLCVLGCIVSMTKGLQGKFTIS